jgi:hypothetical protein
MNLTAYDEDHLMEVLNSNSNCRDFNTEEVSRIAEFGKQRTMGRINGPMDDEPNDHVLTTDWHGFAKSEFGVDEVDEETSSARQTDSTVGRKTVNDVVLAHPNEAMSDGKDAVLFEDAVILQSGWLSTGDGRRTQAEKYVSDDYDDATPGSLWIPRSALEYFVVVKLGDEMVRPQAKLSDAM